MTGAVLLVLFVADCLTLLNIGNLLAARATRWLLLCGSLVAGLRLAFATYHLSAKFGGSHSIIP